MSKRLSYAGVSEKADGRFQCNVRYVEAGLRKRATITGRTKKEVAEKRKALLARIEQGSPRRIARSLLDDWTTQWNAGPLEVSDRKQSTKTLYAGLLKSYVVARPSGELTLAKVTPSRIEQWIAVLRGKRLSPSTIRQVYTVLRAVLETAVRDEAIGRNPLAVVPRPKVPRTEAAHLTPDQVKALLAAADSTRYRSVFEFLVHTGLRRGEALALKWADVDLTNRVFRVKGTLSRLGGELVVVEPKTRTSTRTIPLSDPALAALAGVKKAQAAERLRAGTQWRDTGFVFTTELGEPSDPRNALRALKAALVRHNKQVVEHNKKHPDDSREPLPLVGLDTLRHSAATVMMTAGVPLKVVSEVLGHSSISITADTYAHVSPHVSRGALDVLGAALG